MKVNTKDLEQIGLIVMIACTVVNIINQIIANDRLRKLKPIQINEKDNLNRMILSENVGLTSLAILKVLYSCEMRFNITIPDNFSPGTIGDVVAIIYKLLKKKNKKRK